MVLKEELRNGQQFGMPIAHRPRAPENNPKALSLDNTKWDGTTVFVHMDFYQSGAFKGTPFLTKKTAVLFLQIFNQRWHDRPGAQAMLPAVWPSGSSCPKATLPDPEAVPGLLHLGFA